MIDSLSGEVLSIGLDHGVIECAGVGYRFLAAPSTLGTLTRGNHARILTSMVVKDDGVTLYGFGDDDSRLIFHKLQTVSGLGPKLALAALSVFGPSELALHIANGDAKSIQAIPGVGKKMADRIVLELKDKLQGFLSAEQTSVESAVAGSIVNTQVVEQVVEALAGLGFTERIGRPVVEMLAADDRLTDTAALLRAALAELGKK